MLDMVLRILVVLGIILLFLLGLLLCALLLVLFFPITYRISGEKSATALSVDVRANWLFHLLRVRYAYPEPGALKVKLLWITLFDSGKKIKEQAQADEKDGKTVTVQADEKAEKTVTAKADEKDGEAATSRKDADRQPETAGKSADERRPAEMHEREDHDGVVESQDITADREPDPAPESGKTVAEKVKSWIFEKIDKIKYTIRGIYDKILKIWQNISYYAELLWDEETRLLFFHVKSRLWKILKSLRPRKLKAQVLFGTGAPDTTGYAFGIYGMLLPFLGPDVAVVPDFQQAVLEGSFYAAGHTMVAVFVWHALRVLIDRRLWLFWRRLKNKGGERINRKVSKA